MGRPIERPIPVKDTLVNDFKITIWMHTSMPYDDVCDAIEETLPTASYLVEDQNTINVRYADKRVPTIALTPGSETVEVRDALL
jgi:hypothetical protein